MERGWRSRRDEVVHVARLARLALTEEELDRFAGPARRDPRGGRQGRRARPLGRRADAAPAGALERLGRGRAAAVACRSRRRSPTRPTGGRRLPRPGRMTSNARLTAEEAMGLVERGEASGAELHRAYLDARRRGLRCLQGSRGSLGGGYGGARVIDTLRLTAEEASGLVERGEVSGAELHRAYLGSIAERDPELHAYLCTVEEPEGEGVPIALKDVISTRGVRRPPPRRSSRATSRSTTRPSRPAARPRACRSSARRTWTSSRWAPRPRTPPTARPATPGIRAACPAARRAARPRPSRPGSRRGRSAPTPAARSSSRPRSAASSACGRPTAPSRATASSPSPPASTRSARSRRPSATARSCTGSSPAATRSTRPPSSCPSRSSCRRPRT